MQTENNIQKLIMLAISKSVTIFRNNTGMGWAGKVIFNAAHKGGAIYLKPSRYVIIENPRPLHAGLCKGSSDLIGWKSIIVTPEMVGKRVAVFTALEVKTPTGKISPEQAHFLNVIKLNGGIANIVKNEKEALDTVNNIR